MNVETLLNMLIGQSEVMDGVGVPISKLKSFICREFQEEQARSLVEELARFEYKVVTSIKGDPNHPFNNGVYLSSDPNDGDKLYLSEDDWVAEQMGVIDKIFKEKFDENTEDNQVVANTAG